jgi:hypothetical protein
VTDETLEKMAEQAAILGGVSKGGLVELFKIVRRETEQRVAREAAKMCWEYHNAIGGMTQRDFDRGKWRAAAELRDRIIMRFGVTDTDFGLDPKATAEGE